MRKVAATLVGATTVVFDLAVPVGAQEEPPRGSCNRGTMHAHATVPHETAGNHIAHERIPHCP